MGEHAEFGKNRTLRFSVGYYMQLAELKAMVALRHTSFPFYPSDKQRENLFFPKDFYNFWTTPTPARTNPTLSGHFF